MKYNEIFRYAIVAWLACAIAACGGGGGGGAVNPVQSGGGGSGSGQGSITITITAPASGNQMETPDASVILEGTAKGKNAIVSVEWVNDRGGQGTASGTSTWKTGGIPLLTGKNRITVTARDQGGRKGSRTVVIKRESTGSGSVELSWTAPTHREDGSPLNNLAGFNIHYGRLPGIYDYRIEIDNPGIATYLVEGLDPGTWYFVLSAYDTDGLESNFSNEVVRTVE